MNRRRVFYGVLICVAAFLIGVYAGPQPKSAEAAIWQGEMIRLHVIASSDSEEDQRIKLAVRDALLEEFGENLQADTYAKAKSAVEKNLSGIQQKAEHTARALGEMGPVTVSFGPYNFPTRNYGDTIVPAGTYQALRVVIGSGVGGNWWCVMYPALCLTDADCVSTQQEAMPLPNQNKAEQGLAFDSMVVRWWQSL